MALMIKILPRLHHLEPRIAQDVADLIALLTALMFFTPSFDSQSSRALTPLLAYTGMPSFHVARPQSTPEKSVPDSPAVAGQYAEVGKWSIGMCVVGRIAAAVQRV